MEDHKSYLNVPLRLWSTGRPTTKRFDSYRQSFKQKPPTTDGVLKFPVFLTSSQPSDVLVSTLIGKHLSVATFYIGTGVESRCPQFTSRLQEKRTRLMLSKCYKKPMIPRGSPAPPSACVTWKRENRYDSLFLLSPSPSDSHLEKKHLPPSVFFSIRAFSPLPSCLNKGG